MGEASQAKDLGHLGDVAEHVGQVANFHGASERRPTREAHLQVADDGLTRGQELIHQDVPRAKRDPARRGKGPQAPFRCRANLEVVVDDGHLSVQHKVRIAVVRFEQWDQSVDQVD